MATASGQPVSGPQRTAAAELIRRDRALQRSSESRPSGKSPSEDVLVVSGRNSATLTRKQRRNRARQHRMQTSGGNEASTSHDVIAEMPMDISSPESGKNGEPRCDLSRIDTIFKNSGFDPDKRRTLVDTGTVLDDVLIDSGLALNVRQQVVEDVARRVAADPVNATASSMLELLSDYADQTSLDPSSPPAANSPVIETMRHDLLASMQADDEQAASSDAGANLPLAALAGRFTLPEFPGSGKRGDSPTGGEEIAQTSKPDAILGVPDRPSRTFRRQTQASKRVRNLQIYFSGFLSFYIVRHVVTT